MRARIAPPVCYVMKVRIDNIVFYKIGETHNLTKREKDLQKAYRKATEVKTILSETFPIDDNKRFSDNDVRKYLIANWDAESVPPTIIRGVLDAEADTEFIQFRNYVSDEDICYLVSEGIKDLAKDCLNFHIKLHKDYSKKVSELDKEHWTHLVTPDFMPVFNKRLPLTRDIVGKTILMIGQFANQIIDNFASHNKVILCVEKKRCVRYQPHSLNPENVTIFYYKDSKHDKSDNVVDLTDTMTWEEMIRKVYEMGTKFDYIIANPPYAIANKITNKVKDSVSFGSYINLMPKSDYQTSRLFDYLTSIEPVEDLFDDASVGEVLTIGVVSNTPINKYKDYIDFEISMATPIFQKYYYANVNRPLTFQASGIDSTKKEVWENFNPEIDFYTRCGNGVCESGAEYDLNNQILPKEHFNSYVIRYEKNRMTVRGQVIRFANAQCKSNFMKWYYTHGKNGLFQKLIEGMKKNRGCPQQNIIPRVDWSRPWTDEEILLDYGYTPEEIRKILA